MAERVVISLFGRVFEQVMEQTNSETQIAAKPLDASGEAASLIYTVQPKTNWRLMDPSGFQILHTQLEKY